VPPVDPADDSILRYVVRHYRYDARRRERRHLVVCTFDNPRDMVRHLDERGSLTAARSSRPDEAEAGSTT
jgi:hypothetical protein